MINILIFEMNTPIHPWSKVVHTLVDHLLILIFFLKGYNNGMKR